MGDKDLIRELQRLGKRIANDQSRRDEIIGQLYRAGHGLREIARYANLAHTTVRTTLIRDGYIER